MEIELDDPYQSMYKELADEHGKETVNNDLKKLVQNSLHESINT